MAAVVIGLQSAHRVYPDGCVDYAEITPQATVIGIDSLPTHVALFDQYALVATWLGGIHVLDVADPHSPTDLGTVPTSGENWRVSVSGTHAYVAAQKLHILDISTPSSPVIVSTLDTPDQPSAILVVGSTAYVADCHSGLLVVDVSNPFAPAAVGSLDTQDCAFDLALAGSFVCVADGFGGVLVVDVSNATAPRVVGDVAIDNAWAIDVLGPYAYVSDYAFGLRVVDISDPTNPAVVAGKATTGWSQHVEVDGTYAYMSGMEGGVHVIDVATPTAPALVGTLATSDWAMKVTVRGDHAYVAGWEAGVEIAPKQCNTTPVAVEERGSPSGTFSLGPIRTNRSSGVLVEFHMPRTESIALRVFDVRGRAMSRLLRGVYDAGIHEVSLLVTAAQRHGLANGVYFVELRWQYGRASTKFVVLE